MQHVTFSRVPDNNFSATLRRRVNNYLKQNNINRHANTNMVIKTMVMLTLFFTPLLLMGLGLITKVWLLFLLYAICGFGMAGIGMGVMHDAIHGAYSKRKIVNKILGYTFNLIGANATIWKIQHNMLHHTYTNIDMADDDINTPFFLRFSPQAKHHRIQKFQHIYIWFFYAISTLFWITAKDFVRLKRYNAMGLLQNKSSFRLEILKMLGWKIFYYSYALILPIIMVPLAWWIVVLGFLTMHIITGIMVSIVFQIAHIMPNTQFPIPNSSGKMEDSWYRHQFATTSNFSPKNNLLFWCIGGLNYQVEHHVLPDICHVHYKKINHIVVETAQEYNMPYNVKPNIFKAIMDHIKMLKFLGSGKKAWA